MVIGNSLVMSNELELKPRAPLVRRLSCKYILTKNSILDRLNL